MIPPPASGALRYRRGRRGLREVGNRQHRGETALPLLITNNILILQDIFIGRDGV
jgi:hypothetical protein